MGLAAAAVHHGKDAAAPDLPSRSSSLTPPSQLSFAPESPWHLVRRGRHDEALGALGRLSDGTEADRRGALSLVQHTVALERRLHHAGSSVRDCFRGSDLRRTEVACVVWSSQIWTQFALASGTYFFEVAWVPPPPACFSSLLLETDDVRPRDHALLKWPPGRGRVRPGDRAVLAGRGRHRAEHGAPRAPREADAVAGRPGGDAGARPVRRRPVPGAAPDACRGVAAGRARARQVLRVRDLLRPDPLRLLRGGGLGQAATKGGWGAPVAVVLIPDPWAHLI